MGKASAETTLKLVKLLLPAFEEIINDVRKGHGYLNFDPRLVRFLSKGEASPWALYYQDVNQIKKLALFSFIGHENIPEFIEMMRSITTEEKIQFADKLKEEILLEFPDEIDFPETLITNEKEAREWWLQASDEERKDAITRDTLLLYSLITQVCHYFGLMTFGKSLCDLVAAAFTGDDEAYCQAVQIDKTILYSIPYFRERLARAQLSYDFTFLQLLSTAIAGKPLAGYIKHKELMFVFAILDDEGLLGMPLDELFDLCEGMGVYGQKFGIYDIDSLRKRRSYYLKKTGRKLQNLRPSNNSL